MIGLALNSDLTWSMVTNFSAPVGREVTLNREVVVVPVLASNIESRLKQKIDIIKFGISSRDSKSLIPLQKILVDQVKNMKGDSSIVINNSRHYMALNSALESILLIQKGLDNNLPGDLLSIELKDAINHIGSITGNIDNDQDVLGAIFSQFCIGK